MMPGGVRRVGRAARVRIAAARSIVLGMCLLLAATWLTACADPGGSQAQQAAVAALQQTASTQSDHRRLFYIGLALYSESWSENDVVELAGELRQTADYTVVPLIASNLVASPSRTFPVADDAAIAALVGSAAEQAGQDDIVFVHISTHGARGVLARKIGNGAPTPLTASELARQLAPLAGRRMVIFISACYSGSLINDLRAPSRIIVTATRADRSSFGCVAGRRHTYFGEAELRGFAERDRSLRQIVAAIRDDVARMERADRHTPSEPQVSVGEDMTVLYDAPVF